MGQTAVQSSPAQASKPIAPTRNNTAFAIISRLAIALALFFYFHLDTLVPTLPRLEPIVYPSEPGQDIVYGWRLSIPVHRRGQAATELLLELGKIPDDRLKGRVIDSYAGLADNWLYFRVGDTEQTHVLLASLFLVSKLI